jgi:toxin FitB
MIILDTNVVSEPIKPNGDPAVKNWLDQQEADTLYLTATSLAELLTGVAVMPQGKRRDILSTALAELLEKLFGGRILAFDGMAAAITANLTARARRAGRVISFADCQIAAIAVAHKFSVATRDAAPFEAAGVPVIDPWAR